MSRIVSTSRALNAEQGLLRRLEEAGHEVQVVDRPHLTEADMAKLGARCSALIVGVEPVTAQVIDAAPALRIIARPGVGYERVDVEYATRRGVWVTITPGANAASVADHTWALVLASLRRLTELGGAVDAGEWPRIIGTELQGLVLGVVGLGAIGRAVAGRARAFGMEVLAQDPFVAEDTASRLGARLVDLDDLVANSDVVTLHAPLSKATRGLFGASLLAKFKQGALLVNTARGGLVDEEALLYAVDDGRLSGAALDVLNVEPPVSSPLVGHDRILITPHVAAYTRQALYRMAEMATASVISALRDRQPEGALNPEAHRTRPPKEK